MYAKTDDCVVDLEPGILLLVQEVKRHLEEVDFESQLLAEPIADFQHNNTPAEYLGCSLFKRRLFPASP
jgi:hypothetical protein